MALFMINTHTGLSSLFQNFRLFFYYIDVLNSHTCIEYRLRPLKLLKCVCEAPKLNSPKCDHISFSGGYHILASKSTERGCTMSYI